MLGRVSPGKQEHDEALIKMIQALQCHFLNLKILHGEIVAASDPCSSITVFSNFGMATLGDVNGARSARFCRCCILHLTCGIHE